MKRQVTPTCEDKDAQSITHDLNLKKTQNVKKENLNRMLIHSCWKVKQVH